MAWVVVPGSNNIWEFDNSATAADTYVDANGTTTAGVRSYTPPDNGNVQETYIRCRKAGETILRGELNKNYYDNLIPIGLQRGSMFIPGTNSRITLSPGIVVGGTSTTPFTVEGWFYSTVAPGTNSGPVLLSTDTGSGTSSYAKALTINVSTTTQIIVDSNGAAQQAFNFAETMLVNTWYYVAVTRDSDGYIQVWLGKDGAANATASTTVRQPLNTTAWELTGLSNCVGAFVPAGRYTTGYISNLRVDSTSLYATTSATIPMPTASFTELSDTVFLQNDDTLTDQTGTQTLVAVGTAAGDVLNPF